MIRCPNANERLFVRNQTEASVTFGPKSPLVVLRGGGVWQDEHWPTFDAFRHDDSVMKLLNRARIALEYIPVMTRMGHYVDDHEPDGAA